MVDTPSIPEEHTLDPGQVCKSFTDILYRCSVKSYINQVHLQLNATEINRWKRILDCRDSKLLWRAIDWKGQYNENSSDGKSTDSEFQKHLENLLNPDNIDILDMQDTVCP